MEHNFGMYLTGAEAVKAAQAFTDGHCYRSLYAGGVKLAQVEIVLDDVVEVAYIANAENVEKAIAALAENGFSGVPYEVYSETVDGCYAQQASTGRKGIIGDTTDTTTAQTETKEEGKEMTTLEKIAADMKTHYTDRSAWDRGVATIAADLLEEYTNNHGKNAAAPTMADLLNGADSWSQYSWGGCYLVYDGDIAELLCTPSELKRTRNGERRPNSSEEWLDVQARALNQAAHRIISSARRVCREI